nr:hypothetical protein [uncultured Draconibacterium sp.]
MNNEENAKQLWQLPEIIDLDVDRTESAPTLTGVEDYFTSPHIS